MSTRLPSIADIKIGPDGIADRQQVIELLEAQIGVMRESENQLRSSYEALQDNWNEELAKARALKEQDAKDLKRLRSRQMQILERWVRRESIRRDVLEHRLLIAGAAAVGIPLFIVVLALAWRLATWAVLS